MNCCYFNGQILPINEAKVGILDIGLLRGYGIYEAMTVFNGKIFMFSDHMSRFKKSVKFLNIKVSKSDKRIQNIILEIAEKNNLGGKRYNIKFILTGGEAIGGIDFNPEKPTFYIFVEEWQSLDSRVYSEGTELITHEHLRQYPEYKTTNYITATLLQKEMKSKGAIEILYTWQNKVLECATSNFFIVKDGKLITAKENVLHGITRKAVIDLANRNNLLIEEREVSVGDMKFADECFLTSSFKDVVPVVKVGDFTISKGVVGEVTKKVMKLFEDYTKEY
jgi:branched-subunit amino acid aminotransferase/4-amino-4-deoxychorismate lyase